MNDMRIATMGRWAAKIEGKVDSQERSISRLTPGQRAVTNLPVLDIGIHPEILC